MSKEKKENLVGKISDKGTENVSGGEKFKNTEIYCTEDDTN